MAKIHQKKLKMSQKVSFCEIKFTKEDMPVLRTSSPDGFFSFC